MSPTTQQTNKAETSAARGGTTRSRSDPAPGPRAGPGTQRGCVGCSDMKSIFQADCTCSRGFDVVKTAKQGIATSTLPYSGVSL